MENAMGLQLNVTFKTFDTCTMRKAKKANISKLAVACLTVKG